MHRQCGQQRRADQQQNRHRSAEKELHFHPWNLVIHINGMEQIQQQQNSGEPKADHRHRAVEGRLANGTMRAALHKHKAKEHTNLSVERADNDKKKHKININIKFML